MAKKIILIIAIVIILSAAGYMVYRFTSIPKEVEQKEEVVQKEEEKPIEWDTYSNEKYAYTINYPKDWKVQQPGEEPFPGPPDGVEFSSKDPNNFCRLAIEAQPSKGAFDAEMQSLRTKSYYKETKTKVNVVDVYQFSTTQANAIPILVYFEYQKESYRITVGWGLNEGVASKCIKIFNQMLTNFKFTESYTACGCGCCGGVEPVSKCLYYLKGDDIRKFITEDKKVAQSANCTTAGCSQGIKYEYCD